MINLIEYDQWLIPTSEVSLTNVVSNSIVEYDKLPLRWSHKYHALEPKLVPQEKIQCMIRQHQFTKVELVSI